MRIFTELRKAIDLQGLPALGERLLVFPRR
jgi:hypothetical protein